MVPMRRLVPHALSLRRLWPSRNRKHGLWNTCYLFRHDEVPEVLPAADVLIAPSQTRSNWKEQFGRMVVEAFASGVPVIGSDSGEIPHVVGEAGLIVGESDVKGWAEAVQKVLSDSDLANNLKSKGLERVHQYSAKGVMGGYIEFYRWIAERGVSPRKPD